MKNFLTSLLALIFTGSILSILITYVIWWQWPHLNPHRVNLYVSAVCGAVIGSSAYCISLRRLK